MNHRPCSQYDDQRHGLESDKEEIMKAKETLEGVKHEDRKALNVMPPYLRKKLLLQINP